MVKEQFKALTLPEKYGILIMQKQYACNKDKMQLRTAIFNGYGFHKAEDVRRVA